MKRKFKHVMFNNFISINKTKKYDIEKPGPGFGLTHKCDKVKMVNGVSTLLLFKKKSAQIHFY